MKKTYILVLTFLLVPGLIKTLAQEHRYYFSTDGDDLSDGSRRRPWKSIEKLNKQVLGPGDKVFLKSGDHFEGTILLDSADRGSSGRPVVIGTYEGAAPAFIYSDNKEGLVAHLSAYVTIRNLSFRGKGRKEGNTVSGVVLSDALYMRLERISVQGYQKSGVLNFRSSGTRMNKVHAFDNGYAGISVSGQEHKKENLDIRMVDCLAENNPGDPSNLKNHSGNGIVVSHCTRVLIDRCVATGNGWDMPRKGNGPVGIWAFEADSVLIQRCISYRNKTSEGGSDGGGFDLDGGVTHSAIQFCLSYENQGSGFGLFQYAWASNWYNNTLSHNISENDGRSTHGAAGIMVWNSSGDENQLRDALVDGNIIYNDNGPALIYDNDSRHRGFVFRGNVWVGKQQIIAGQYEGDEFSRNVMWSIDNGFAVSGHRDYASWSQKYQDNLSENPGYRLAGTKITHPDQLKGMRRFELPRSAALSRKEYDLLRAFKKGNRGR